MGCSKSNATCLFLWNNRFKQHNNTILARASFQLQFFLSYLHWLYICITNEQEPAGCPQKKSAPAEMTHFSTATMMMVLFLGKSCLHLLLVSTDESWKLSSTDHKVGVVRQSSKNL